MLETLFVSLTVALISGLTYVAYKYPSGYLKIYQVAYYSLMLVWCISGVIEASMSFTYSELKGALEYEQREVIAKAYDAIDYPVLKIYGACLAIGLYLYFLKYLPQILADDNEEI